MNVRECEMRVVLHWGLTLYCFMKILSQLEFPLAPDIIDIDHASCDYPVEHVRVPSATWERGGEGRFGACLA